MKSAEEIVELIRAKKDECEESSRRFWSAAKDTSNERKTRMQYKKWALDKADKAICLEILLGEILGDEE